MAPREVTQICQNWHFKQADQDETEYRPVAQFPTQVHLDLLHHGLIPDPFIGKNETVVQWVGEKAWVYKTTFDALPPASGGKAVLVFDGLDTFAVVTLNGKPILETSNMFIHERVDVSQALLKDGKNSLEVHFDSASSRALDLVKKQPEHKWGCWNGDLSRLAVRKAQYHWGWDWGPKLLTCGPWRPIKLEYYDARISDMYFDVDFEGSFKFANVTVHVETEGKATAVRVDLYLNDKEVATCKEIAVEDLVSGIFRIQDPELWNPVGYGKQTLYAVRATLLSGEVELDSVSRKVGLRKVEVVQHGLKDGTGTSFFFQVNGTPIFCGGSNWIPADSFVTRLSRQRYYEWVKLVAEGNQCMLRVWGGGIYEEQALYDACDEFGILVWHDFMFACGNYPADKQFLVSVEREARDNVKLLRHHPSIVLWAGNNEDYQYAESSGLRYDPNDTNPRSWLESDFPARYIYEKLLPDVCKDLIPSVYYHPGSPWSRQHTNNPKMGDTHQWNVWHGSQRRWQDFDQLMGRFVSEFGMESFPSVKTIDAFLPKGGDDPERSAQSSTVDFHNKATGHEERIKLYLSRNFRYSLIPLEYYVYCTQLMQAECAAYAYRLWRRQWRGPEQEYCGGALIWQMNDCWPVISWSICDYYLRPKKSYFLIKREMAPLTVGIKRSETKLSEDDPALVGRDGQRVLQVWGSNLRLENIKVDCVIKAWDAETGAQTYSQTVTSGFLLPANRSTEIISMDIPAAQSKAGLEGRTVVAAYLHKEGLDVARSVNWPEPFKSLRLQKAKDLRVELSKDYGSLQISAEVPIKGLAIDCDDDNVTFSDNMVDLLPGECLSISVKGATLKSKFAVQYLDMNM